MFSLQKNNRSLKIVLWAAIITAAVALDQYTKYLAVKMLKPIGFYPLWEGVFHLTYVENTGAAFGILKGYRWVFMMLSAAAVGIIIIYLIVMSKKTPMFTGIILSLIASGGIGNMIDRIKNGFVVDFLDFTLIKFAVFNVADSCVTVGAVLMIIYMFITEIKAAKTTEPKVTGEEQNR